MSVRQSLADFRIAPQIRDVWSIRHETPGLDPFAGKGARRQPRVERKCHDASTVGVNECVTHNVKCVRLCLERLEGGSNAAVSVAWIDSQ
jgi:hypothetical protein